MIYTAILVYFLIGGVLAWLGSALMIGRERKPLTPGAFVFLSLVWLVNVMLDIVMWLGTR